MARVAPMERKPAFFFDGRKQRAANRCAS